MTAYIVISVIWLLISALMVGGSIHDYKRIRSQTNAKWVVGSVVSLLLAPVWPLSAVVLLAVLSYKVGGYFRMAAQQAYPDLKIGWRARL